MYTNNGPRRPVPPGCRILSNNVQGLSGNLNDLTVACLGMIYCSESCVGIDDSLMWSGAGCLGP